MQRLTTSLSGACGEDNACYTMALRFAGFAWQYRENLLIQTRVYRCVGQYALKSGYRYGMQRFADDIADEAEAKGMVSYLYECAVPGWARSWFESDEAIASAPPSAVRTRPAPGPGSYDAPARSSPPAPKAAEDGSADTRSPGERTRPAAGAVGAPD
ncbi:hypothetical protein [Pararhizobium haloflavum]|uniref:hypothetical protein n=1 Tax=Pararhizobium haloflavum TaxID=2037914 RepID=UPI0012FFE11A|nr:hypothetical protein [Pararhizobium haloflavum]